MKDICPICHSNNNCQVDKKDRCWCMNVKLSKATLLKMEREEIVNMCICMECLVKLNRS